MDHDPVIIEAHRLTILSASMSAPPDGMSPRLITGESGAADMGLDQEAILHEMIHAVSSRLHGNGTGLGSLQARSMGEGWSDFYPRALLSSANEGLEGIFAFSPYSTAYVFSFPTDAYYYGLRRFPFAIRSSRGANGMPHSPLTFADIDPTQINTNDGAYPRSPLIGNTATEVHNAREIWCLALMEVRARLIRRLGFAEGNKRALQLVTDGMKLDPLNPIFLQGRDAILAADQLGFNGADFVNIWRGFAVFHGGEWWILQSATNVMRFQSWGLQSDQPLAGDFDGDNLGDVSVFRPSDGTWYILSSSNNAFIAQPFGQVGDRPVVGDYDGDGRDDVAVFRDGVWYIKESQSNGFRAHAWGLSSDRPVPGDYDGDGKTDLAVFRPLLGTWFVLQSSNTTVSVFQWGQSGDTPIPSAYLQ